MLLACVTARTAWAQNLPVSPVAASAAEPRPAYPNLDNLIPAQAAQRKQIYQQALQQWKEARLAAMRASEGAPPLLVPPRPARPKLDGLTPEQREAAIKSFQEQMARWIPLQQQAIAAEDELKRKAGILFDPAELARLEADAVTAPVGSSWQRDAADSGLSPSTVAQLDRDSLAIAGPYFMQSFEVYNTSPQPSFVTSDSLLNGFHVLLEDSIQNFELIRIRRLRGPGRGLVGLDAQLARSQVPRAEIEPFAKHLALVIGPALRLLGSDIPLGDSEVEKSVATEVAKIEAAVAVDLPSWLAPADRSLLAIDYRRCRPIGFYAENPELGRYYEAVRWLQMIPLRASRDVEVGAAALLAALGQDNGPGGDYHKPALAQFVDNGTAILEIPMN